MSVESSASGVPAVESFTPPSDASLPAQAPVPSAPPAKGPGAALVAWARAHPGKAVAVLVVVVALAVAVYWRWFRDPAAAYRCHVHPLTGRAMWVRRRKGEIECHTTARCTEDPETGTSVCEGDQQCQVLSKADTASACAPATMKAAAAKVALDEEVDAKRGKTPVHVPCTPEDQRRESHPCYQVAQAFPELADQVQGGALVPGTK